jgi:hypothetical protein
MSPEIYNLLDLKMEILARTFVVHFDEEAALTVDWKVVDKVTINLTGTHEQIAGFLCLFFALHGENEWSELPDDQVSEFFIPHWFWCENRKNLAESSIRYIITNLQEICCEAEFATNDINQFVSGMSMVTTTSGINPEGNWRTDVSYFDFTNADQRAKYLDLTNDDPIEGGNPLGSVDISEIPSLIVKIEIERSPGASKEVPPLVFRQNCP